MRQRARSRGLYAIAIVLVLAATGGAYAAGKVGPDDIAKNAIRSRHVANGSLTGADLRPLKWVKVKAGPKEVADPCPAAIGMFCGVHFEITQRTQWHNLGSGQASAAFTKDASGMVRLQGLVTCCNSDPNGETFLPIFYLPAQYRPSTRHVFSAAGAGVDGSLSIKRVDIDADGRVALVLVDPEFYQQVWGFLSLDGISFAAGG